MARPPAGPQGNSPRDVRDDAVGVPAENVIAPEPPRWPPKRKKITSNTFHAKVSGGSSGARADRKPHFRRGGMVKSYAAGGAVKREEGGDIPSLQDTTKGSTEWVKVPGGWEKRIKKAAGGPVESKNDPTDKAKLKKGGPVAKAGRFLADGGDTSSPKPGKPWPKPRGKPGPIMPPEPWMPPDMMADGGKLSAAQRQALPKSSFALPGKGEGPKGAGSGSYPIPDPSHARNALARVSQHGSSAEKAAVRAKVKAKYPGIGQK